MQLKRMQGSKGWVAQTPRSRSSLADCKLSRERSTASSWRKVEKNQDLTHLLFRLQPYVPTIINPKYSRNATWSLSLLTGRLPLSACCSACCASCCDLETLVAWHLGISHLTRTDSKAEGHIICHDASSPIAHLPPRVFWPGLATDHMRPGPVGEHRQLSPANRLGYLFAKSYMRYGPSCLDHCTLGSANSWLSLRLSMLSFMKVMQQDQ